MSVMPEDETSSCTTVVLPVTTVANDGINDRLVVASDAETIMQVVGSMTEEEAEEEADMSMGSDTKEYIHSADQMVCLDNSMSLTADGLMLPPEGADGDVMENSGQIIVSQTCCDGSVVDEPQHVTLVTDMCNGGITMETEQQVMLSAADLGGGVDASVIRQQDGSIALVNTSGGVTPPLLLMTEQLSAAGVTLPDGTALQTVLATHGSATFTGSNGETIQIITVNHPDQDGSEPPDGLGGGVVDVINLTGPVLHDSIAGILMPPPQITHNLPPGCPTWAARLKDCEQIGDSFRGWVETEVELDLVLTFHKQQTMSFWGTRQSPSPAKQSTRLMWKSQYVPFDGIPFINAGSRAVVMECQYGPRRKGSHLKRQAIASHKPSYCFTQTCPARIYIKKVRKFPEFAVDLNMDKKSLKLAMDKSFHMLKAKGNMERLGQERFYVQLPTEKAHEFHSEASNHHPPQAPTDRLHPRIVQKIRDLVACGETRLYVIRKNLRRFVEKELFGAMVQMPEKHNLSYYPTVNDLQNNIHQALQDIESGVLPVTAQMVNMEVVTSSDGGDSQELPPGLWQSVSDDQPHAETVTVTLTQSPGEDGQHVISRVETHLSDGTTQVSASLTSDTIRLLAKLHPNIFPEGSLLQFRDGSTQPVPVSSHSVVLDSSSLQRNAPSEHSNNKDNIESAEDEPLTISTVASEMITVPQSIVLNAGMTESMVHADLGKVIMQVPFTLQTNNDLCGGDVTTGVYHQMEPHEMEDSSDMMVKQLEADSVVINEAFSSDPETCIKLEDDNDADNDNNDNDAESDDTGLHDEQEES